MVSIEGHRDSACDHMALDCMISMVSDRDIPDSHLNAWIVVHLIEKDSIEAFLVYIEIFLNLTLLPSLTSPQTDCSVEFDDTSGYHSDDVPSGSVSHSMVYSLFQCPIVRGGLTFSFCRIRQARLDW